MDLSNENIIHVNKNGIQYLQFKKLLEFDDKIKHCYTLKPLNLRFKTKQDEHYIKICDCLGLNNEKIVSPEQTHTNVVKRVFKDDESCDFCEVDGLITDETNKILSLVFADCTSFFIYDPVKNVIGDIHSGWKGTVAKIGKVAVEALVNEFGCNPSDMICCIGPTIRQCHFQVEEDVKNLFMDSFEDETIIKIGDVIEGKQKYYIDAVAANIKMFKECGLKEENIIDSGLCTVCNHELLHSHRFDGNNSGRNAAIFTLI